MATAIVAIHGVCRRGWILPRKAGSVRSLDIANNVRVTWIRVVSSVAIVDSMTAITKQFAAPVHATPAGPGPPARHQRWPGWS